MVECLLYVVNYIDYIEECYIPILNLSGTWFSVVGNGDNYIAIISSQTFFSFCKKKENSKKKKKKEMQLSFYILMEKNIFVRLFNHCKISNCTHDYYG